MNERHVDVAIIGAGTAGLAAYSTAGKDTGNLVLIEKGPLGTLCARAGCMPSKLLIAAAERAEQVRRSHEFGIGVAAQPAIDGRAVMGRVRRLRDRFVQGVIDSLEQLPEGRLLRGEARFLDNETLEIDGKERIKASAIVIATGSRPRIPRDFADLGNRLLTTDTIFELDTLPNSLAVFGAGASGLELAQAFHRLGVEMHLFGLDDEIGPLTDPDVHAYAKRLFTDAFPFDPDSKGAAPEPDGGGVAVKTAKEQEAATRLRFEAVLAATGRVPRIDMLDLENTTLKLNENGLPSFDRLTGQCGDTSIFIAGDVDGVLPLLHEAAHEGRIAGENAVGYPELRSRRRKTPLGLVFTSPQIAVVGEGYRQLATSGRDFCVGSVCFEDQGRARVIGENEGLLNVYGECGSGRILGAEMIAPSAEHLSHLLALAIERRLTVSELLDMPFYHPVLEEGLRTALHRLNRNLMKGPEERAGVIDCGPGT